MKRRKFHSTSTEDGYEECKKFPEWDITIDNILTAIGDENVIEFFISVGDIYLSQQLREVIDKGIF